MLVVSPWQFWQQQPSAPPSPAGVGVVIEGHVQITVSTTTSMAHEEELVEEETGRVEEVEEGERERTRSKTGSPERSLSRGSNRRSRRSRSGRRKSRSRSRSRERSRSRGGERRTSRRSRSRSPESHEGYRLHVAGKTTFFDYVGKTKFQRS